MAYDVLTVMVDGSQSELFPTLSVICIYLWAFYIFCNPYRSLQALHKQYTNTPASFLGNLLDALAELDSKVLNKGLTESSMRGSQRPWKRCETTDREAETRRLFNLLEEVHAHWIIDALNLFDLFIFSPRIQELSLVQDCLESRQIKMVVAQESCWKTLKEVHDISACLWCDFLFSNACDIYVSYAAVSLGARSLKHIASSDKWKKNAHEEVEVLKFVHQTWHRWKSVKWKVKFMRHCYAKKRPDIS